MVDGDDLLLLVAPFEERKVRHPGEGVALCSGGPEEFDAERPQGGQGDGGLVGHQQDEVLILRFHLFPDQPGLGFGKFE